MKLNKMPLNKQPRHTSAKPRKCKSRDPATKLRCNTIFTPDRPFIMWCSPDCAINLAAADKAKKADKEASKQAKELREGRERLKTLSEWKEDVQTAINAYCRERDLRAGHNCICCDKPFEPQRPGGSIDAGHWLGRGSHPNLRFEETNIHAQRKSCNRPGGTTAASFRLGMIRRIGLESVEALESDHAERHYTISDCREMIAYYRAKLAELRQSKGI